MDTNLLFLFPLSVVSSLFYPRDKCPSDVAEWNKDKHRLNCSSPDYIYHCLLDDKRKLGEICIKGPAVRVQKGYCPQYNSFARAINTIPCRVPKGCSQKAFASNEVYIYPACLHKEDIVTTIFTPKDQASEGSVSLVLIIIPVLVVTLLLASLIIYLLCRRKHRENAKSMKLECGELEPLLHIDGIPFEFHKNIKYLDAGVFVSTESYMEAVGILETYGWIILIGPPGSGKTMTAIQLARRKLGQVSSVGKKCIVHFCRNLRDIFGLETNMEEPYIILDDLMEMYLNYPVKLSQDKELFYNIFTKLIQPGLIRVLITIREDTWNRLSKDFLHPELFKPQAIWYVIKTPLTKTEKREMLKNHLRINNIRITHNASRENLNPGIKSSSYTTLIHKSTIEKIVTNITGDSAFSVPIIIDLLCANMFLLRNYSFILSGSFKQLMKNHLMEWMKSDTEDDKNSMCVILFAALCGGSLSIDDFESHTKGHIYMNVCKTFHMKPIERHEIESMLKENLRVRGFLYPLSKDPNTYYVFHHDSLLAIFLINVCSGEKLFIENANIDYILKRCKLTTCTLVEKYIAATSGLVDLNPGNAVEIPATQIEMFLRRIIAEKEKGNVIPDWKDHVFMTNEYFKNCWQKTSIEK